MVAAALLAACIQAPTPDDGAGGLQVRQAPGALSTITDGSGKGATVTLPAGTLLLDGTRWVPAPSRLPLAAGASATLMPSPGEPWSGLQHDGRVVDVAADPTLRPWLDGRRVLELVEFMGATFPDRDPATASYARAVDWAAQHLEGLGYEVEVDPYGTRALPQTVCPPVPVSGRQACPASFANVVATKRGRIADGPVFVVGGHFDIVPQVTYGAYDNTAGAMSVVTLAEALAPYEFNATLVFALWGGEESGTLGSSFWLSSHAALRPRIASYWNMDTVGLSWPAPRLAPGPLRIHVGPEAGAPGSETQDPVQQRLTAWLSRVQHDWLRLPDEEAGHPLFVYSGAVEELPTTDHAAFMAMGVPSFVPETFSEVGAVLRIHTEMDTLDNMTRYAWDGTEADFTSPWASEADRQAAWDLAARSFEPVLSFAAYHLVLADQGWFNPIAAEEA